MELVAQNWGYDKLSEAAMAGSRSGLERNQLDRNFESNEGAIFMGNTINTGGAPINLNNGTLGTKKLTLVANE